MSVAARPMKLLHGQSQLYSSRAPPNSVWKTSNKTERIAVEGWGAVNLSHLLHIARRNSTTVSEKVEVDL